MSAAVLARAVGGDSSFPDLLKTWRHLRRLSQLDPALSSGVSQRHVSFLESGRANPITANELRIESLFPADAETEALFRAASEVAL